VHKCVHQRAAEQLWAHSGAGGALERGVEGKLKTWPAKTQFWGPAARLASLLFSERSRCTRLNQLPSAADRKRRGRSREQRAEAPRLPLPRRPARIGAPLDLVEAPAGERKPCRRARGCASRRVRARARARQAVGAPSPSFPAARGCRRAEQGSVIGSQRSLVPHRSLDERGVAPSRLQAGPTIPCASS
jgi:hypothetical protein